MNARLLIDAIVRQTTVLVAQLSTAAGIRAPLAHIADEVFTSLAREIEAQGVGRKVAADMFGMALRTYQKKTQRLAASATDQGTTLWEAILDFLAERGDATRRQVLERFRMDGEREVVGVLTDLVSNGLVHASGRGAGAVYGLTSDGERRLLADDAEGEAATALVWATIKQRGNMTVRTLAEELHRDLAVTRQQVARLVAEGRVTRAEDGDDAALDAQPLVIPVGAEQGWEAAVFDHFRAVASAIAAKVAQGRTRSATADVVGGATLSFELHEGSPYWDRVHGLLARTRAEANALWQELEEHQARTGPRTPPAARVWFYFGQYVELENEEEES